MKILSIIPARGGSKGIPLKNLTRINGKPMLYYTINASLNSKFINRTIVSTDHKQISLYAKKFGIEVLNRPKKLAGDLVGLEPVITHILNELHKNENYIPDIIVILQNTSPLRTAKHVDGALRLMLQKKYDSILSGFSIHTFLWKYKQNGVVTPINYNPKKRQNRQKMSEQLFENGAIFATKYKSFMKSKCRISGNIGFYVMPLEHSYNIDTKEDLFAVRKIIKKLNGLKKSKN